MAIGIGKTIGSDPHNEKRSKGLKIIQDMGFRGIVSVTAYYGADIYDVTDDGIEYKGFRHYGAEGYEPVNYAILLRQHKRESRA